MFNEAFILIVGTISVHVSVGLQSILKSQITCFRRYLTRHGGYRISFGLMLTAKLPMRRAYVTYTARLTLRRGDH